MQHAGGAPLPPPPRPGQPPATVWSPAAHHPQGHPGPAPATPPGFGTGPVPPPGCPPHTCRRSPRRRPTHPRRPVRPCHRRRRHPRARGPARALRPAARALRPARAGPAGDHRPCDASAGRPVGIPHVPPAAGAPDVTATTLAVLLIGPAGAGKTSVAKYWADRRRVPTAHISLDDVREWVRSGFADPQSGWNDNSEAQYRLARRTCGFAARNFLANGISCILDDAVFPDRPVVGLGGWKRHVGPGLLPVVLLPGLEIVLERNAERSGNRRLSDEEVARIHGRMAGWYGSGLPIIDNSHLDVPSTARLLDDVLARAIASPPTW